MKYLPTTTLTVDSFLYVWIVVLATLAIVLWIRSNFASTKAKEEAAKAEGILAEKPQYGNRNLLRILSLMCVGLIAVPAMAAIKQDENNRETAQANLAANIHQKYQTEAMKISMKHGMRTAFLNASYEGTQLISLKKGKGFDIYYLTQDKETNEPFLYASDPAEGFPVLTNLETKE